MNQYSSDEEDFWPGEEGLLQKHLCTPDDAVDTKILQAVNDVRCRYKQEDFQLDNNNIVIHNDKFRYQVYDPFTRKSIPREYSHTFSMNNRKEVEPGKFLCILDDHSGWTCSLKPMRSADMKSHHDSFLPHRCLECGKFVSGSGAIRRHLYTHEWKTRWSACKVLPERKRTSFDYSSKPFVSQVEPPFLRPKVKKVVAPEPPMNVIDPRDQPKALRQQRGNKFDPSDFHIDDKHIIQMRGSYRYQIYDPVTRRSVPKEWSENFSTLHRVQVRQDKYLCSMPDHAGRPCAGKLRTLAEIRKHHKDNLPHRCLICNRFRSGLKSIRVHFHLHGLSHLYNKRSDSEAASQTWTSQRAKKVATNRLTLKSNLSHRLVNRKDPKIALAHWKITGRAMYPKPRALIPRWPMSCKQPAINYKELESESEEEDMNPLANPNPNPNPNPKPTPTPDPKPQSDAPAKLSAKILFRELCRGAQPAQGKHEALPKPVTRQGHPAIRRVTSVTSSSPRNPIQNLSHGGKPVRVMVVTRKADAKPDQLALQERMRELEAEMARVRQSLSKIDNNSQSQSQASNKRPSGTSQIREDSSVDSGMNCLSNTSLSESNEIICASQIPSHISMKKDIDDSCLGQDRHELSAHSSQVSDYATNSSGPHSPRMRDYDQFSGQPSPQNSDSLEERFFSHTPGKTKFTPSDFFLSDDNIFNVDGRPSYQVYNPISRKPMSQEELDRFMDENVVCDESGRYSCGFPYHQGKECSKKACEKPRVIKGHLEHSLPCRCMICDEFHVAIGMVRMHIRRRHPGCRVKGQ